MYITKKNYRTMRNTQETSTKREVHQRFILPYGVYENALVLHFFPIIPSVPSESADSAPRYKQFCVAGTQIPTPNIAFLISSSWDHRMKSTVNGDDMPREKIVDAIIRLRQIYISPHVSML